VLGGAVAVPGSLNGPPGNRYECWPPVDAISRSRCTSCTWMSRLIDIFIRVQTSSLRESDSAVLVPAVDPAKPSATTQLILLMQCCFKR
jgi:hypothetical protein